MQRKPSRTPPLKFHGTGLRQIFLFESNLLKHVPSFLNIGVSGSCQLPFGSNHLGSKSIKMEQPQG
jgi:hypothetical protein